MTCRALITRDGKLTGFLCSRGERRQLCSSCKRSTATKLCDFRLANGKTCDRPLCAACAVEQPQPPRPYPEMPLETIVRDSVDYCPAHARLAAQQFEGD